MAYDNKSNPSDIDGSSRSQSVVIGVVVDDKDPTESGRFRMRIVGEQDDSKVSDQDLPWYPTLTNGQPQLKGIGSHPAGAYLPGSRVAMLNLGQQGFVILGSLTNSQEQEGKQDRNPEATKSTPLVVNDGERVADSWFQGGQHPSNYPRDTKTAMGLLNSTMNAFFKKANTEENRKEQINNQAPSKQYGNRKKFRWQKGSPGNTIADQLWNKTRNAQKQVKGKQGAELIKQAVDMMEKLKKSAESGSNFKMTDSVGGFGNIISGLQSIAKYYKEHASPLNCDCTLEEHLLSEECKEECKRRKEMEKLLEEQREQGIS